MLIMNHFLDVELLPGVLIPDVARAEQTNSVSSILAQSDLCYGNFRRMPNVVLVSRLSFFPRPSFLGAVVYVREGGTGSLTRHGGTQVDFASMGDVMKAQDALNNL